MKTRNRSNKLRIILLLFYTMIALLPVVTYFSVYNQSLGFITDQEMESQSAIAANGLKQLETSLHYADAYSDSLISISQTVNYMTLNRTSMNRLVSSMQSLHKAFPIFNDINGIFLKPVIYSASSQTMIDRVSSYLDLPRHFDKLFDTNALSFTEWSVAFLQDNAGSHFIQSGDSVFYTKRLMGRLGHSGKIFFTVNKEELADHLRGVSGTIDQMMILMDREKHILYSNVSDPGHADLATSYGNVKGHAEITDSNGERQVLCSTSLSEYDLTLYTMIPKSYFVHHAYQISLRIIRYTIPLLLASIVLLFLLLRSSHKPLYRTITSIPETPTVATMNPFRYVEQSFSYLSDVNHIKEIQLQNSHQNLLDAALSLLLYQNNTSSYPIGDKLRELGMNLEADQYRVLVFVLLDLDEKTTLPFSEQMHTLIQELSIQHAPSIRYLKMGAPDEMVFLSCQNEKEGFLQLQNELSQFCWYVTQTISCGVRIYVGDECDQLDRVHHSFKSARDIRISNVPANGYLVFRQGKNVMPAYDYLGSDSTYLRSMAGIGNIDAIQRRLQEIYQRNTNENARSSFEYLILYTHMLNTLIESGYQKPFDNVFTNTLSDMSPRKFFDQLSLYYGNLCEQNQRLNQRRQTALVMSILEDIQNNYADYNLSLTSIATKHGMNERKLSALIKTETGSSFPEYVEKLRIDKAIELLKNTSMIISDVALTVGYGNDQSFRRAFKRFTGKLPTDIRL